MRKYVLSLFLPLTILACSTSNDNDQNGIGGPGSTPIDEITDGDTWLIPINEIRDGGPGKDGIPSVDNPNFTNANNVDFLDDNDLVIGIINNNEVKAYPHIIMDWHEISNDQVGNDFVTINYCPLTGTAFAWESIANGIRSSFGVSGLLYNANLILYDRNTDSNWSQLGLECVNGELISAKPILLDVVETDWKTWRALYPDSKILNRQTGFSRNYGTSPYGDYATNNNRFIFRPNITNPILPNKERVYCIIDNNTSKVYQFSSFAGGKVIKDSFNDKDYLIVGNESIINAFELSSEYFDTNFQYEYKNEEGTIFTDDSGNAWSIFGEVISGPNTGESLGKTKSVVSYWFAIAAFYPNPEIYS
ncbi:hypothetical protein DIS18_06455 [Algibacter marinivivus]|uniref:DUF3179 domain-containing protein n=1 Tax=Algibacter marinivivus TaxID=2100723 RepID=A0A2U2X8R5_9FLAO|nr:DUF3179 domain-containing protein [Algibacter marinivivus]PWH84178.1 hypothetical protein DIS18_06455 [Algibacter marinivivus]